MVCFAFHDYLATSFYSNIFFFAGNYIPVLFANWNDVSIYFVSHISQVILGFVFADTYTMQEGSHNISHLR